MPARSPDRWSLSFTEATGASTETQLSEPASPEANTGWGPGFGALLVTTSLLIAAALRLWEIGSTYELFIDEVTYANIALNVTAGKGLLLYGEPFHLHPPGLFGVLAATIVVLDLQGHDVADVVYALRHAPAVFGALTPALVAILVRRVTSSWGLAAGAGALLAIDPFLIRFDSRVLLEAQAMAFAALGIVVLSTLRKDGSDSAWTVGRAVLAGLCMLGSLLTKETYAFVSVLPVLVLLVTGVSIRRRFSAIALGTTLGGYLVYVVTLVLGGQFDPWIAQKTKGVARLLGFVQISGFNQGTDPTFLERLLVNLVRFGVTYALIGIGGMATFWLLLRLVRGGDIPGSSRSGALLLIVWASCAQAHLAYALTIGTLEEQMFYLLVVTVVPVLCVAAKAVLDPAGPIPRTAPRLSPAALRSALGGLLALALLFNTGVWWQLHRAPDNSYAVFLRWAETELPAGSRVATTDETSQFVLEEAHVARLETGEAVRQFDADYLLVVSELLAQGYSKADADLLQIAAEGRVVFSSRSRTVGRMELLDVSAVVP